MRILIDECIDERFRNSLPRHECQTARYAGLAGLKNGELLITSKTESLSVFWFFRCLRASSGWWQGGGVRSAGGEEEEERFHHSHTQRVPRPAQNDLWRRRA
jgi:hypothetical protein